MGRAVRASLAVRTAAACRRTLEQRGRGTPQGSAVSPVLANLFMHYAFDLWLAREFPTVRFERYCDDAVVHCGSERQALAVKAALADRLAQVGLTPFIRTRPRLCTAEMGSGAGLIRRRRSRSSATPSGREPRPIGGGDASPRFSQRSARWP